MFLSRVSHQLLLILKAGFTRDRQQWKCDEITAAVLCFKAQGLYRLGTKIKYSEGVNPGHLLLSEQKLVHRRILCITSGRSQAPWALQIPQVKGVKESKGSPSLFPIPTSGPMRGTVDTQRAVPASRLPEELQEQTCPIAPLLPACCRAL